MFKIQVELKIYALCFCVCVCCTVRRLSITCEETDETSLSVPLVFFRP